MHIGQVKSPRIWYKGFRSTPLGRNMKILQLITTLTGGGAERQLSYVSRELQARGHQICVGHFFDGTGSWPAGIEARRLPRRNSWHPLQILDVLRLIREWKPDVVQTWNLQMDVVGGLAAAMAGVPWVVREGTSGDFYGRRPRSRLRYRIARAAAKAVVANSAAGESYWQTVAPRVPRMIIPNAVPLEAIESSAPIERRGDVCVGLFVGRFAPIKNVDVVLRACAAIMAEREVLLFLCGDGPERERLIALAAELGVERSVRFTGFIAEVWGYLRAADFVVLLSDFEGRPNAVTEAFAAGAPVILSDIPAHRELAVGGAATLVPLRDVAATAQAIRDVLDDPRAAFERSTRARRLVADWTIASSAAAFESLYARVVATGDGRSRILIRQEAHHG